MSLDRLLAAKGTDLGHGVTIDDVRVVEGKSAGIDYVHTSPDGARHLGYVALNLFGETTEWDLVSVDPLTLSPSLLCRRCGHHGFIRDGRWVPA